MLFHCQLASGIGWSGERGGSVVFDSFLWYTEESGRGTCISCNSIYICSELCTPTLRSFGIVLFFFALTSYLLIGTMRNRCWWSFWFIGILFVYPICVHHIQNVCLVYRNVSWTSKEQKHAGEGSRDLNCVFGGKTHYKRKFHPAASVIPFVWFSNSYMVHGRVG